MDDTHQEGSFIVWTRWAGLHVSVKAQAAKVTEFGEGAEVFCLC